MTEDFETSARRAKLEQIAQVLAADAGFVAARSAIYQQRADQRLSALEILDRFRRTANPEELRDDFQKWSRGPGFAAFGGVSGQMFLNQLVKAAPDLDALGRLLIRCFAVPASMDEAVSVINELAAYTDSVKKGAHPAPRRSIFVLSFIWSLQDETSWPCFWPSAEKMLEKLGWLEPNLDLGKHYAAFASQVLALGDPNEVETAMLWLEDHRYSGLHPTVIERCRRNLELNEGFEGDAYAHEGDEREASIHARAILGELASLGEGLADKVASALGRSVKTETPSLYWVSKKYRADGWVRWSITDQVGRSPVSLRLWVTSTGMFIGLHPGFYRDGWYADAARAVRPVAPASAQMFPIRLGSERVDPVGNPDHNGEFLLGWHYPEIESSPELLERMIVRSAADLQPALDRLAALFGGRPSAQAQPEADPLRLLVDQFIAERPYPSARDEADRADRQLMAATMAPDEVRVMDLADVRKVFSTARYGSPGSQSVLNTTLRDATPAEVQVYLDRLHYLLWGEDDDAARIDSMLDPSSRWIKGLGESGIMKFLAVVHPDRYVPVYPYGGDNGKVRLIKALGLAPPPDTLSAGQRQVRANDILRERLDPLFPNDPWGQAQFAYWLAQRPAVPNEQSESDVLAALADELLVSRGFIAEVVELLRDKGQVIFYGPPGTGKTWVARALAKALAPDPTRRSIVQFHPSTSYEDFFEGFRPEETGGQLSYHLRKGPLALMADLAESAPGVSHVLVIDELNRANLPKVFGELLFLLEYRDEQVRTIYRPDDAFSLPENLLFIGTMNTADRSIALVDAALRRRFHFIPFFPDDGEMDGLLQRWLERAKEPTWVADLVEMVNAELTEELGGPDLQIGPSYFMRSGIADALPKIWKYNVEPLIQDQLFGQGDKIRAFSYEQVLQRFNATSSGASESVEPLE